MVVLLITHCDVIVRGSAHLSTAMYEGDVCRGPEKSFEMRVDKMMDKGNGEQIASETFTEKSPKHQEKQPLILLWNRYQARSSAVTTLTL